jgi:hypothetical protein
MCLFLPRYITYNMQPQTMECVGGLEPARFELATLSQHTVERALSPLSYGSKMYTESRQDTVICTLLLLQ